MKQRHHDGHGLNDLLTITCDDRDPNAGGCSHVYKLQFYADNGDIHTPGRIEFQHGPRHEDGSTPGITDAALIAVILDRYEGFQAGPYRCRENSLVITKLEEALHWMQHRANDRAARGVLGKDKG